MYCVYIYIHIHMNNTHYISRVRRVPHSDSVHIHESYPHDTLRRSHGWPNVIFLVTHPIKPNNPHSLPIDCKGTSCCLIGIVCIYYI